MRIAVMGAGSMGGCLGGLLARAGNDVTFITRGAHLDAIQRNGLRVRSHLGDFTVDPRATDDPGQVHPVDLVLFTVKTYHNVEAIPLIKPLVRHEPALMTFQNGVESYEELGNAFGIGHVMPGVSYAAATIESPGVIIQESNDARIVFGELNGWRSPRALRVHETMVRAGIEADLSNDVIKALWTKFLLLAPVAGITSASRLRIKQLLQIPASRATFIGAMQEVKAIARAKRVDLEPDIVADLVKFIEDFPDFQNSMHADIELGRPLELEALNGAVVRMGRELGVPTPIHSFLYSILLPHKDGSKDSN